ncbi:MAG TPA: R3H domain-containing nucleic acid-binding protein [Segeticoccus sp.]|nr:R3H domain-containing nucleic acid-binding protein [Segeticoccus sp.]
MTEQDSTLAQAAAEQPAAEEATAEQVSGGEETTAEPTAKRDVAEETAGEPTAAEQTATEQTASEQTASEQDEARPEQSTRKKADSAAVEHLEQEGEVAADFLERLLDIADLDGDIDVDVDGDRASVAIVDSDDGRVPRRLVGPDGRTLEALQELTRLAVQASTGERSRLMLDVAGHRAQRRDELVQVARTAIERVQDTGEPEKLEPMTAFERKVVHDEVLAAGLVSESAGSEPHRHVVVEPARDAS